MIMLEHKVWVTSGMIYTQTWVISSFEHDDVYISFMWQVFLCLILNYYLQLICHREDFTLALTSIVHSRIVSHRHMDLHCLLRIKSKIREGLVHYDPFIAYWQLM